MQKLSTRETLELHRAIASHDPTTDRWILTLPRILRSPNATLWRHWRIKQRERRQWTALVLAALVEGGVGGPLVRRYVAGDRTPANAPRRRVTIERWLARPQQLIRDRDNLAFCGKHLVDALVAVGLLHDDDPAWADRPTPTQQIAATGRAYTVVILEPAPETEGNYIDDSLSD